MLRKSAFRPSLETLESRSLLTGSITLSGANLLITADAVAPLTSVVVTYDPAHTSIVADLRDASGEVSKSFPIASVLEVDYAGNNGQNRFVNVTDVNDKATGGDGYNFFMSTGNGDNAFSGGNGVNVFIGFGNGKDTFSGGSGTNVFADFGTGVASFVTKPGSRDFFIR